MRYTVILGALLTGCASPALMTPEQLKALSGEKSTVAVCSEVSTLTTTVRTVYVQVDKGSIGGTVAVGAECAVAVTAK